MDRKSVIAAALLAALAVLPSCLDDTTKPVKEKPPVDWPDMTSRDDVVRTVVLAYANPRDGETAARYDALLHSQYFFKLHESDVAPGESAVMTRAEDIASTGWIFENETLLELSIPLTGSWFEAEEIEGEPCEGCLQTTREYSIRAQFGQDGTIFQSPVGKAYVTIIVAPDESDAGKWVLRAIYDIMM